MDGMLGNGGNWPKNETVLKSQKGSKNVAGTLVVLNKH